jgi:hypothetical protein
VNGLCGCDVQVVRHGETWTGVGNRKERGRSVWVKGGEGKGRVSESGGYSETADDTKTTAELLADGGGAADWR